MITIAWYNIVAIIVGILWIVWLKKVGEDYWIFANGMNEVGWQFLLFPPYEKIRKRATLYADNLHEIEGQLTYYSVELIPELRIHED